MLAQALPPLRIRPEVTRADLAQAFAFCYLASYAHDDFPVNVTQAFQRAYGVNAMVRFPRDVLGKPNMVVAKIPFDWGNQIIIAIEGTSSMTQIMTQTVSSVGALPTTAPAGRVPPWWLGLAQNVATRITAHADAQSWMADVRNEVTVAGYSLGAAVGEIFAAALAHATPTRTVRLRKFASPRVGNAEWNDNRPRNLDVACVYRRGDLMHCLPNDGFRVHSVGPIGITGVPTFFQPDPVAEQWAVNGLGRESIPQTTAWDQTRWAANYLRAVTPESPIYQHVMNSYRHMFDNRNDEWRDLDAERWHWLEYPDDNKWQLESRRGEVWDPNWIGLLPTSYQHPLAPANEEEVRLHGLVPQPELPPSPQRLIQRLDASRSNVVPLDATLQRRRNRHAPQGSN